MLFVNAWPICSAPVTLGGGMTTTNLGLVLPSVGVKKPHFSHHCGTARSIPQRVLGSSSRRDRLMERTARGDRLHLRVWTGSSCRGGLGLVSGGALKWVPRAGSIAG